VDTEDINYECVGYYKWMPKLRYESKAVRDYINSIGRYWLERFDIDGYRLDVCDEVDYTFWYEFRKTVKSIKPTAVLIGETWKNGSDLLRGDSMDTIMNYRIRNALVDFIVDEHIDIKQFLDRVESIYFDYPYQTHNMLYNLLGSHDTERVITLCKEDTKILKLLVSILFALPGMPFIYYGDEIGTKGENDPLSRKTMNWNNIRNDIHMYYLKKTEEWSKLDVLKLGDFKHIYTEYNMIYAFERNYEEQKIIFVANCNNKEQLVKIEDYNLEFTLLPYESEIIKI
jgi:glycosidase